MSAPIPEDLRDDYEDFARPSDSVKEAAWRLYARKFIKRIAALEQERDQLRAKLSLLTDPAAEEQPK